MAATDLTTVAPPAPAAECALVTRFALFFATHRQRNGNGDSRPWNDPQAVAKRFTLMPNSIVAQ